MISVCLTTYNGEKFLLEQITSILNQLSICDELIISDDGSVDNTVQIIRSINDSRIKFYSNCFGNVVKNFEFTIAKANGNVIFLSDQDDIWADDKVLNHLCMYVDDVPRLVLSDYLIIDSSGVIINEKIQNNINVNSFIFNLIKNNGIGCTMSFNKELKNLVLPFPKFLPMHDWWILLCAILLGKVSYINSKCTLYRRHDNNYTKYVKSSMYTKLKWRIYLLLESFKRVVFLKSK